MIIFTDINHSYVLLGKEAKTEGFLTAVERVKVVLSFLTHNEVDSVKAFKILSNFTAGYDSRILH